MVVSVDLQYISLIRKLQIWSFRINEMYWRSTVHSLQPIIQCMDSPYDLKRAFFLYKHFVKFTLQFLTGSVYDVSDRRSFDDIPLWLTTVNEYPLLYNPNAYLEATATVVKCFYCWETKVI
jgi:hypothetical protein